MAMDYSICLDIGGTKVLGAIFDKEGKPVYRLKKKTKSGGESSENIEQVIISVVQEMIQESLRDLVIEQHFAPQRCAPKVLFVDHAPAFAGES